MARKPKFVPPGTPADYRKIAGSAKRYEYAPNGIGTGTTVSYRAFLNLKEKFNEEGWTAVRFQDFNDLVAYGKRFKPAKKFRGYVNAYGRFREAYRGSRGIIETEGWRNIHPGATFDRLFSPSDVADMLTSMTDVFEEVTEFELAWRII